jgi:exopolysaccharide biosynthesis protein
MVTARAEERPRWEQHWFSLTCGPRLLKEGGVCLNPEMEGFKDDHVLGIGPRAAIGFPKSKDKLYLVTFTTGLSLEQEAKMMKAIGCSDAMNLDGGASKALAHNGKIIMKPGRALTNVLVVYDVKHPAPKEVLASLQEFRNTHIMPKISLLP